MMASLGALDWFSDHIPIAIPLSIHLGSSFPSHLVLEKGSNLETEWSSTLNFRSFNFGREWLCHVDDKVSPVRRSIIVEEVDFRIFRIFGFSDGRLGAQHRAPKKKQGALPALLATKTLDSIDVADIDENHILRLLANYQVAEKLRLFWLPSPALVDLRNLHRRSHNLREVFLGRVDGYQEVCC